MTVLEIKAAVRERDGQRCIECGLTAKEHIEQPGRSLEVHRIVPGSIYTIEGCVTLCRSCHGPKPRLPRGEVDLACNRTGKPIGGFIDPDVRDAVDRYLAATEPAPSITGVLEVALRRFLASVGFWPPPSRDTDD